MAVFICHTGNNHVVSDTGHDSVPPWQDGGEPEGIQILYDLPVSAS